MMINKRLIGTVSESKKFIARNVAMQNSKGRRCAKPDLPAAFGAVSPPPATADR